MQWELCRKRWASRGRKPLHLDWTQISLWSVKRPLPETIRDNYRDARTEGEALEGRKEDHPEPQPTAAPEATRKTPSRSEAPSGPEERQAHLPRGARPSREALLASLRRHEGNIAAVAAEFGRQRPQVYRWLKYLEIDLSDLR